MKKLESSLKNMVLSLLFISVGMSAALGFVYNLTKDPIAQAQKEKSASTQTFKPLLPAFDNNPAAESKELEGLTFYKATHKGNLVGWIAKTYTEKGYSGRIDLLVGFLPNGKIYNVAVSQHNETPGLGSKMNEAPFKDQFKNLDINVLPGQVVKVKKDGGTLDAISAATISSRAFCDGVQKAYSVYMKSILKKK